MAEDAPAPVRMEPIATLPVFFKLQGQRVVLAGGTPPAVWKAELLAAAGAQVAVFAADSVPALDALAAVEPAVTLVRRDWTPDDLGGAAMALGAIEDDTEAERFQAAARAAGVPVNVIDKPAFCDFQFGTVVSRSPLVIGISTDGAAPVFGQAIRTRIEALLPQSLRAWAEAARDWRPAVQAQKLDFRGRRRVWEVFAARALDPSGAAPSAADLAACLAAADQARLVPAGRLTLVGAGPGTPDGVTLQAIGALQDADLVFHGAGVPPLVVALARREAEKTALPEALATPDAAARVRAAAAPGRRIVWLDAGNPVGCRLWAERADALADAGLDIIRAEGLGLCAQCTPSCPRWCAGAHQA